MNAQCDSVKISVITTKNIAIIFAHIMFDAQMKPKTATQIQEHQIGYCSLFIHFH